MSLPRLETSDGAASAHAEPGGDHSNRARSKTPIVRSSAPLAGRNGIGRLNVAGWPGPAAAAACAALLGLIVLLDVATGPTVEMAPFFFFPIILASLRFQARGGLIVAGASAILAAWPSPVAVERASEPFVFVASVLTETLAFFFVALVTGALHQQGEWLRRHRAELQEAHRRLQEDVRAAELLQGHLLRRPLPEIPGLDAAVVIRFARGVGGDFYDLRRVGEHLSLCVADVSGKGAQAALISAALRTFLDDGAGQRLDPAAFLRHLNSHFFDALPTEMFVTMFYGILDLESGELTYSSAGHDPAFLCRAQAIEKLMPTAPALGIGPDLPGRSRRVGWKSGETLLLYTDGLTNARLPEGGRVGEERVIALLRRQAELTPDHLLEALLHLACPDEAEPLTDDIALLVLRRR